MIKEIVKSVPSDRIFRMEIEMAKEKYNVISYRYKDGILKMEVEELERRKEPIQK